ncbi:hypothetical protein C8F04DRAFT_1273850 [Mycena alexandri]|uniref:Uncharacterized protein n=1 Tax=Mycena alexandri TaxID=1745969 RepID=A0AAD6S7Q4_9AGAR|nr:hypothetical protein C8F04DRAFT_1273850 [Mycena alexandri]
MHDVTFPNTPPPPTHPLDPATPPRHQRPSLPAPQRRPSTALGPLHPNLPFCLVTDSPLQASCLPSSASTAPTWHPPGTHHRTAALAQCPTPAPTTAPLRWPSVPPRPVPTAPCAQLRSPTSPSRLLTHAPAASRTTPALLPRPPASAAHSSLPIPGAPLPPSPHWISARILPSPPPSCGCHPLPRSPCAYAAPIVFRPPLLYPGPGEGRIWPVDDERGITATEVFRLATGHNDDTEGGGWSTGVTQRHRTIG